MPAKPIPGLGLVLGVIAGYATMVLASLGMTRLAMARAEMLKVTLDRSLPWLGLLLAVALVLSVLMALPAIGAGVMTGAGAFMTVFGLAFVLVPMRQTFDMVKLFRLPGTRLPFSYSLLDGSFVLLGIVVLVVGVRRWASDAKVYRLLTAQGQAQDRAYNPALGGQQWGGYPGQQQSPGQQPQPGQPQHGQQPQQPQYGGYPGQQQQGGYPGQQQPQHYGQQPPGEHPGQQQPPR